MHFSWFYLSAYFSFEVVVVIIINITIKVSKKINTCSIFQFLYIDYATWWGASSSSAEEHNTCNSCLTHASSVWL